MSAAAKVRVMRNRQRYYQLYKCGLIHHLLIEGSDRLNTEQNNHSMRGTSSIIRRKPIEESDKSILFENFDASIDNALIGQLAGKVVGTLIH